MMKHLARDMPFETLYLQLSLEVENGNVVRKIDHLTGLHMFTYSKTCVYEKAWNGINILARGLILHPETKTVVATPFPKFFNYGEMDHSAPLDRHFEAHEKVDGSLIICYHWNGDWRFATKGSFNSSQAIWAAEWAFENLNLSVMDEGTTYLFEAVYPENRIVVQYAKKELVLLSFYNAAGYEVPVQSLVYAQAEAMGCRAAVRHPRCTLNDLAELAKTLPATHEGWVIRFDNGHRIKIKGAEYLRLHRMLSNLTPLSIWEMMRANSDVISYRKELPEEFWADFDTIYTLLFRRLGKLQLEVATAYKDYIAQQYLPGKKVEPTDKEVGLYLERFPEHIRRFIFPYRQTKGHLMSDPRSREAMYRAVRPTNNHLEGYVPSTSTQRVMEELNVH